MIFKQWRIIDVNIEIIQKTGNQKHFQSCMRFETIHCLWHKVSYTDLKYRRWCWSFFTLPQYCQKLWGGKELNEFFLRTVWMSVAVWHDINVTEKQSSFSRYFFNRSWILWNTETGRFNDRNLLPDGNGIFGYKCWRQKKKKKKKKRTESVG